MAAFRQILSCRRCLPQILGQFKVGGRVLLKVHCLDVSRLCAWPEMNNDLPENTGNVRMMNLLLLPFLSRIGMKPRPRNISNLRAEPSISSSCSVAGSKFSSLSFFSFKAVSSSSRLASPPSASLMDFASESLAASRSFNVARCILADATDWGRVDETRAASRIFASAGRSFTRSIEGKGALTLEVSVSLVQFLLLPCICFGEPFLCCDNCQVVIIWVDDGYDCVPNSLAIWYVEERNQIEWKTHTSLRECRLLTSSSIGKPDEQPVTVNLNH